MGPNTHRSAAPPQHTRLIIVVRSQQRARCTSREREREGEKGGRIRTADGSVRRQCGARDHATSEGVLDPSLTVRQRLDSNHHHRHQREETIRAKHDSEDTERARDAYVMQRPGVLVPAQPPGTESPRETRPCWCNESTHKDGKESPQTQYRSPKAPSTRIVAIDDSSRPLATSTNTPNASTVLVTVLLSIGFCLGSRDQDQVTDASSPSTAQLCHSCAILVDGAWVYSALPWVYSAFG